MAVEYRIRHKPFSLDDCYKLYQKGVNRDSFNKVAKEIARVPEKEMANVCKISQRSISRMKSDQLLPPLCAEIIISIIQVYSRAVEVFGSEETAHEWLKTPLQALEGKTPLQSVSNRFEAQFVMDILGRIEYGVYS